MMNKDDFTRSNPYVIPANEQNLDRLEAYSTQHTVNVT
jgi:hypothetical protein